jgi:hypothetical protein
MDTTREAQGLASYEALVARTKGALPDPAYGGWYAMGWAAGVAEVERRTNTLAAVARLVVRKRDELSIDLLAAALASIEERHSEPAYALSSRRVRATADLRLDH